MNYTSIQSIHPKNTLKQSLHLRKNSIYKYCRIIHGYLSAFAFIMLMFFAATGLFLNHPQWFKHKDTPQNYNITLQPAEITAALHSPNPTVALVGLVRRYTPIHGEARNAHIEDDEANIHADSINEKTTIAIDLTNGTTTIAVEKLSTLDLLKNLHKAKHVGKMWSTLIDITAITLLILSLVGYIIFFSLKRRLLNSLLLTALAIAITISAFYLSII